MLLKRNLLSIIYSVLFIGIFGIAFLEVAQLAISGTKNGNILACILVLGIAIYMIGSFFIKEAGYLDIVQRKNHLANMAEGLVLAVFCVLSFVLSLDHGLNSALLIAVLLAGTYTCARMLGGRLCGCAALIFGFFFFMSMSGSYFSSRQYIDVLCFIVPYAVFLLVTRKFAYILSGNSFMLFFSYFVMGIVFSLAIILNPLVSALLVGCILSLIFGEPENKGGSALGRGVYAAGILTLISVLIFGVIYFLLPDMVVLPETVIDPELASYTDLMQIFDYMILKFTDAMKYICTPFEVPVFPALLVFMGCVAGFFSIRRSSSGIGPLCLATLFLLGYYLIFNKNGAHFYYMTYMLPVFAAYGFSCTLVLKDVTEAPEEAKSPAAEEKPAQTDAAAAAPGKPAQEAKAATAATGKKQEKKSVKKLEKQPDRQPEKSPAEKPDKKLSKQPDKSPVEKPDKKLSKQPDKSPVEKPDKKLSKQPDKSPGEKLDKKAEKKREKKSVSKEEFMRKKSVEKESVIELQSAEPAPTWGAAEIPEWTVSPDFLPGASKGKKTDSEIQPEQKREDIPQQDEKLTAAPAEREPEEEALISRPSNAVGSPEILEQEDVAGRQAESSPMPDYNSLSSDDVLPTAKDSFIRPKNDVELEPEEAMLGGTEKSDSGENTDAQLNTLLARLDMSDPIRRMNETAREDIADVIEREEEQQDLFAAIPAAELDYEEPADESDAMLDLDLMAGAEEEDDSTNLDLMPETGTEAEADSESANLDLMPEMETEPENESVNLDLMPGMDTEQENESVTLDLMPESELQMQFPEMEWESEPELKLEPQPQAEPEPKVEYEPEPELKLEPQPQAAPEPEVEYKPEPEPAPEPLVSRSTLPKYVKPDFDFKAEPLTRPLSGDEAMISEYDKVPTITDLEHKWREVHAADNEQPQQEYEPEQKPEPLMPEYTPQPEPLSTLEPELEPLTGYESEPQSELVSASGTQLEFTAMPEYAPQPESLSELEPELEPMPEYTSEPQAEPVSASGAQLEFTAMPEYTPEPQPEPRTSGFAYSLDEVSETLMRPEKTETDKEMRAEKQVHTEEIVKRTAGGKRSYHRITLG